MGCNSELKSKILTIIYQRGEISPEKISDITKASIDEVKACGKELKNEKLIEECCGKYSTPAIVGVKADYSSGDDGCSGAG
ncbi:MAG: hypothetical protein APG12_00631 [Candidatus Methanofastidiosum methylothiophilum]|uniref:Uncharacterized protein n=1 Tax=Candidatus Methanofastidiosum methylothiophilum TaxID=1705564 RepID=A0A150IL76_9EURY|nr:MAG: hypothetical protein APG10_00580 [Candidatus Methanofastidiosum methylthiophilus]KYC48029.1 MAG: hypothetical protein APG11_00699 [Candidatus Methanofastidiosum methylthiophilus]KYC50719.1 MAG: hypothetical protein APG12_00631 [Candidatus Methanofastidiosum methylthiophilus]